MLYIQVNQLSVRKYLYFILNVSKFEVFFFHFMLVLSPFWFAQVSSDDLQTLETRAYIHISSGRWSIGETGQQF